MGIFESLKKTWKSYSTEEKIGMVIDVICGIGGGCLSHEAGKRLSAGKNIFEAICIRALCYGAGLSLTKAADKELRENWAKPAGTIIDALSGKPAVKKSEEEA